MGRFFYNLANHVLSLVSGSFLWSQVPKSQVCDFHTGQQQALSLSTSPVGTQHVEQGHRGWGQRKQTRLRPLSFLGLRSKPAWPSMTSPCISLLLRWGEERGLEAGQADLAEAFLASCHEGRSPHCCTGQKKRARGRS